MNIGPLSGTSTTVTLPTNGAAIYVRLWTVINGSTFLYNDYTYTEFTVSPATMTGPTRQHADRRFDDFYLEGRLPVE